MTSVPAHDQIDEEPARATLPALIPGAGDSAAPRYLNGGRIEVTQRVTASR